MNEREANLDNAERLRDIASILQGMAHALEKDDAILGSIAGQGLANHLPGLPKHIRDVFLEYLSDDAARSYKADLLYLQEQS